MSVQFDVQELTVHDILGIRGNIVLEELETLRAILSTNGYPLTRDRILWVLRNGATKVFIARVVDALVAPRIVGMISLCKSVQLQPGKAWGEDLVVLPDYRHNGVGEMLLLKIIYEASNIGIENLDVTSSHLRTSAAQICYALGFKDRDSRLMRLKVERAGDL